MIKSSRVLLSPTELREIQAGKVPTRLSAPPWELTLEELEDIVQLKQYDVHTREGNRKNERD